MSNFKTAVSSAAILNQTVVENRSHATPNIKLQTRIIKSQQLNIRPVTTTAPLWYY